MEKAYKFRIYPNKEQQDTMQKTLYIITILQNVLSCIKKTNQL
jgi:transposase